MGVECVLPPPSPTSTWPLDPTSELTSTSRRSALRTVDFSTSFASFPSLHGLSLASSAARMVCVRGETELETWLLSQGFPVSFGGWDFKHWTCDDLRRAIRFFDRHAHVEPRKIEMCQRLCIIRPEVLTQAEQQEVNRIRAARQADRVLQDRSYSEALTKRPHGKKRQRSNSNDSERSEITAQPSTPKLRPTMRKQRLPTPSTFLGDRKHSIVFAPQGTPALPDWGSWSDYPPTPPTPTPATRECQICVSAKPVDLFPSLPVDAGCRHSEPITCISCLARHIEARSQTSQLNAIPCQSQSAPPSSATHKCSATRFPAHSPGTTTFSTILPSENYQTSIPAQTQHATPARSVTTPPPTT